MVPRFEKEFLYWICVWRKLKMHCFSIALWNISLCAGILITLMFFTEKSKHPSGSPEIILISVVPCVFIVLGKIADAIVKANELYNRVISIMETMSSKKSL